MRKQLAGTVFLYELDTCLLVLNGGLSVKMTTLIRSFLAKTEKYVLTLYG